MESRRSKDGLPGAGGRSSRSCGDRRLGSSSHSHTPAFAPRPSISSSNRRRPSYNHKYIDSPAHHATRPARSARPRPPRRARAIRRCFPCKAFGAEPWHACAPHVYVAYTKISLSSAGESIAPSVTTLPLYGACWPCRRIDERAEVGGRPLLHPLRHLAYMCL